MMPSGVYSPSMPQFVLRDTRQAQRRTRVVSCTECHRRKQKCDRESPCNQCILRKVENLCQYANENRRKRAQQQTIQQQNLLRPILPASAPANVQLMQQPLLPHDAAAGQSIIPSYQQNFPQQYYPTAETNTSSFYAAAAAHPAQAQSFEPVEYVPSASYPPPTMQSTPHSGTKVSISFSGSDHGSLSAGSDGADDDSYSDEDDLSDYGDNAVDLADTLGYFRTAASSVAQDIKEITPKIIPTPVKPEAMIPKQVVETKTNQSQLNRLLRAMPPKPYADLLIKIFFDEANFYRALNRVKFLEDVENWWELEDRTSPQAIETACLMFRVLAIAVEFVPDEHIKAVKEIDGSITNLTRDYNAVASEIAELMPITVYRIIEIVLKASWYKCDGRMKDSCYCILQGVRLAHEMKLNVEALDTPPTYERELRRRTWWILHYWDRFMGLSLSRPFVISPEDGSMPFPLDLDDADYYPVVNPNPPMVTPFTPRLMQYHLGKLVTTLDSDPALLYRNLCQYAESLPAYFRLHHADTSYDQQFPFLFIQRERMTGTICMVACAVYRQGINIPNPLSYCLRLLQSCETQFKTMKRHHYAQFIHTYRNLEPAVLICRDLLREIKNEPGLAERGFMLRARPIDVAIGSSRLLESNDELNAWTCLQAAEGAMYRLREFRQNNKIAGYAYKVLKVLVHKVRIELRATRPAAVDGESASTVDQNMIDGEYHGEQYVAMYGPGVDHYSHMSINDLQDPSQVSSMSVSGSGSSQASPPVDVQAYGSYYNALVDKLVAMAGTDFSLDWFQDAVENGKDLSVLLLGGGNQALSDLTAGLEIRM
ncbi:hypothetical protein V1512DRAFT_235188 [Lipomyces arxii]|uniref:uncharacterized protein n=1 Tax=Lipomyces arxii TaxID=56418 RepID=UPI0034CECF54